MGPGELDEWVPKTVAPTGLFDLTPAWVGQGAELLSQFTLNLTLLSPSLHSLFQADVRDEEALYRALEGVDCVFHVASYGMSGAEKVRLSHSHL